MLDDTRLADPKPAAVAAALLQGIREMGLACLPWTPSAQSLRARLNFLHRTEGAAWPDCTDEALLVQILDVWLAPWLEGASRRSHLSRLDMTAVIEAMLPWEMKKSLDQHAPTHVTVPSGSRIAIDYQSGDRPVLAVRLQEMFGLATRPRLPGDGQDLRCICCLRPAVRSR